MDGTHEHSEALLQSKCSQSKNGYNIEGKLPFMGVVDIIRESTSLIHINSPFLMVIMAAFLFPASLFILCHVILDGIVAIRLSMKFQDILTEGGIQGSPFTKFLCLKLSQTIVSYTFYFPVFISLSIFAKAAIAYTVSCTYAGKNASIQKFLLMAPMLWKHILLTYFCLYLLIFGATSMAILTFLLVRGLLEVLQVFGIMVILVEVLIWVVYSVIFGHMVVIGNLAYVVSVSEECYGWAAIMRSLFLMKGRTKVALLLFLVTALSMAMVESLFQYHVISNLENGLWRGPLLVIIYSLLYLLDVIMNSVFYFSCKSTYIGSTEKNWVLEQISVGFDLIS